MSRAAAGAVGGLGLCLFVAGVLLWRFGEGADRALFAAIHLHASSWAVRPASLVSALGGMAVMAPVALVGVAALALRGRSRRALWLLVTIASGRGAVEVLKLVVGRARPALTGQLVPVISLSFPSSHSAGSMLTCAALALAFGLRRRAALAVLAWPVAVGCTRVMLGVHWPSDVLAGWGAGLLWAALQALWLPPLPAPRPPA